MNEVTRIVNNLIDWKHSERLTDPENFVSSWAGYSEEKREAVIVELVTRGQLAISFKLGNVARHSSRDVINGLTRTWASDRFLEVKGAKR